MAKYTFKAFLDKQTNNNDYECIGVFESLEYALKALEMIDDKLKRKEMHIEMDTGEKSFCIDFNTSDSFIRVDQEGYMHPVVEEMQRLKS